MGMTAKARHAFLVRLVADRQSRRELSDAAVIEERKHERTSALSRVVSEARKRRARR